MRVHPAPLYEMALLLALTAGLWRARTRVAPDGALFFLYLGFAGAIRFAVEIVSTNRAVALGMTETQWTSLALVAVAGLWLSRHLRARAAS